jgi:predicted acylesterase/phospholipase RssA/CRP-like cAMP-binding protein
MDRAGEVGGLLPQALHDYGLDRLDSVVVHPGDEVLRRGETGEDAYWVECGRLEVLGEGGSVVAELGAGSLVGEFAVLTGSPRSATVVAAEPCRLRRVPRAVLDQVLAVDPDLCTSVRAEAVRRIRTSQLRDALATALGDSSAHVGDLLAARVVVRDVPAGEAVVRAGDAADGLLVVVSGRVRRVDATGEADGYLGPGSVLGADGLVLGQRRAHTLEAVRDTVVAAVPADTVHELLVTHPAALAPFVLGLVAAPDVPRRSEDRFVALAVTTPYAPSTLVDDVAAHMGRVGPLTHLSSARVDGLLGRPGMAQSSAGDPEELRLLEMLARVERDSSYVLLEPDPGTTPWSRRALRQSDVVALVTSPEPDEAERRHIAALLEAAGPRTLRVLVLLQRQDASRPVGATEALAQWSPDHVLHARSGSQDDLRRLARILAGRPLALVLGGGGAKGFAALGVLQAMSELGLSVDTVAATSIGAPLGAGLAQGHTVEGAVELVEQLFHNLLDYTLPVVSLLKGERASRSIRQQFEGWQIEDLWLPYACVSTNLTQGRAEVHRRGDLVTAVRASVAIPGAFPPVPWGDDLLVDGGVRNNLPADVARRLFPTAEVIAVEAAPAKGPRAHADFGLSVSGWEALRASVGRDKKYPGMMAVLVRSMITGSLDQRDAVVSDGSIDLLLDLDLRGVALLDFDRVRDVAQKGYEQARPRLEQWLEHRGTVTTG